MFIGLKNDFWLSIYFRVMGPVFHFLLGHCLRLKSLCRCFFIYVMGLLYIRLNLNECSPNWIEWSFLFLWFRRKDSFHYFHLFYSPTSEVGTRKIILFLSRYFSLLENKNETPSKINLWACRNLLYPNFRIFFPSCDHDYGGNHVTFEANSPAIKHFGSITLSSLTNKIQGKIPK